MGDGPLLHRVRERVRPLVPKRLRVAANRAVFAVVALALSGNAVHCPCCGHSYRRFSRYPTEYCPACGSYERQRLLCLYLDRNPALVTGDVLQVGPERSIKDRYKPRARRWLAVDVEPGHPLADETMDVRRLALPERSVRLRALLARARHRRGARPGGRRAPSRHAARRHDLVQAPWRSVKGDAGRLRRAAGASRLPGDAATARGADGRGARRRRYGLDSDDPLFVCRALAAPRRVRPAADAAVADRSP